MADPNDSDGSWEFVDKDDTASEASSESPPYDSGLPEEAAQHDEELIGSTWNNREEFVTDSDIEACTEEPLESEDEGDVTVIQEPPETFDTSEEQEAVESGEDSPSSSCTKSVLSSEDEPLPQTDPSTGNVEDGNRGEDEEKSRHDNSDDSLEDVTSQENADASSADDIILPTTSNNVDLDNHLSVPLPDRSISAASSHSDFERIASSSDIVTSDPSFDPGSVEIAEYAEDETTEPKSLDSVTSADGSETGSVDFTVLTAPSSPPVEVTSQETETSVHEVLPNQRSVGMVTVIQWTNPNVVDTATGSDEIDRKTVGVVTDHAPPQNKRLFISVIMLSFGVGFLVGRCPAPTSTILLQYQDTYAPVEKAEVEDASHSIQHLYHGYEPLPQNKGPSEYVDSLLDAVRKAKTENDWTKFKLSGENSKLKNRNRGLRSTIRKLKAENNQLSTAVEERVDSYDGAVMALGLLRQTCETQQRMYESNLQSKEKKIKQLEGQMKGDSEENVQESCPADDDYENLMALYQNATEALAAQRSKLLERQHGMKLRLRRYRLESKKLIQELEKARKRTAYLELMVQQNDVLRQPSQRPAEDTMSPFMQALFDQSQTCLSESKLEEQAKVMKQKVKVQKSMVRKLEEEVKLKSVALEVIYNAWGNYYATCVKQKLEVSPPEDVKDVPGIRRSAASPSRTVTRRYSPDSQNPQSIRPLNLTIDLYYNIVEAEQSVPKADHQRLTQKSLRLQQKLKSKKAEYCQLRKLFAATNRSLDVAKKQKENVKGKLNATREELKQVRQEKKELRKKLNNVTAELNKKTSVKECLQTILNTDAILQKVNGTKTYKAATKMAQKVQKAGGKAWNKFQSFVNKFSKYNDDYDDDDDIMGEQGHDYDATTSGEEGDLFTKKKQQKSGFGRKHKAQKQNGGHFQKKKKQQNRFHNNRDGEKGTSKTKRHDGKDDRKEKKKVPSFEEIWETDEKQERKQKKGQKSGPQASTGGRKKHHRFHDVVSKHVDMAKQAGEKVVHHLMPIYDGIQKLSCNIEQKIAKKSLMEIWESFTGDLEGKDGPESTADAEELTTKAYLDYLNFTFIQLPRIEFPNGFRLQGWNVEDDEAEMFADTMRRQHDMDVGRDQEHQGTKEKGTSESAEDSQWFIKMFQAREDLRKDWGDSPLSDKEFDWFLQMFSAREDLRQSGESYPGYNNKETANNDLDWFIKMFEARARLRFENTDQEKNWYLKMSEARKKARAEVKDHRSTGRNWYQQMFKAREEMRGRYDNDWYNLMAAERQKAKYMHQVNRRGDWFSKRMKSRENSRERFSDY